VVIRNSYFEHSITVCCGLTFCKYFNRKIKDSAELEAATKQAQVEEMARLRRLQEIEEQVWQQAALDRLCLERESELTLPSHMNSAESEMAMPKSFELPTAVESTSLHSSSATATAGACLLIVLIIFMPSCLLHKYRKHCVFGCL